MAPFSPSRGMATLTEGLYWRFEEQVLYFIDIPTRRLWRLRSGRGPGIPFPRWKNDRVNRARADGGQGRSWWRGNFLLSDTPAYIIAANLLVDSGYTAH